ncbi:oxidative stress defense protein [Shewanella electrodiphila]|uniref:Oxidative stress defense protein n=1 Tax=Shewanella electrodiphila TaxID=934143 RepID=A0ABT0KJ19_9GAMM|nr:oxidative stress defense protein [Shewanella electrodiphila]MCL1043759.1 oxidative stress defense protein [Shewanella electrodiphila]
MTQLINVNTLRKTLLSTLIASGLVYGLTTNTAIAANYDFPHLETVGTSQVKVAPDMAEISVQVSLTKDNAKEAKTAVDEAVVKFIKRLKQAGVSKQDIQSANLHIQPQYHYPSNQPKELTGYSASRQLTVSVKELAKLNDILDSALEEGINRVQNIALKSSDETQAIEQARQAAIKDAKQKAHSLAQGFDRELDGVWEIRYLTQHPVQPVMMRMSAMQSDMAESYQYGEVSVEERVEVIYRLK